MVEEIKRVVTHPLVFFGMLIVAFFAAITVAAYLVPVLNPRPDIPDAQAKELFAQRVNEIYPEVKMTASDIRIVLKHYENEKIEFTLYIPGSWTESSGTCYVSKEEQPYCRLGLFIISNPVRK